jgi:hypothetical protein
MLAIYPKLDGCTMELSHNFPSKQQLREFFSSEFGVNTSFYHMINWSDPSTGTVLISKPFGEFNMAYFPLLIVELISILVLIMLAIHSKLDFGKKQENFLI